MDFTLEENDEVMVDLNKSFYIDDELDVDLKRIEDPVFEETQLDFNNLSMQENVTVEKKSHSSKGLVLPKFGDENLLGEALDDLFDKNNYKSCKGCGKLKNLLEYRTHKKRCLRMRMSFIQPDNIGKVTNLFNCIYCAKTFSKKSALVLHTKTARDCGKTIDGGDKVAKRACKHCSRTFSDKNLSRHLFHGTCKGLSKVIKTIRC